jgi:hypothetical protein
LRQAAFFPRTLLRKMSAGSQMDMPTARTENLKRFSRSAAAVGILRVHGRARIAPHAPISSLLHNVGKHARLCGGAKWIRTLGPAWLSAKTADFCDFPFSNHGNRKK